LDSFRRPPIVVNVRDLHRCSKKQDMVFLTLTMAIIADPKVLFVPPCSSETASAI
jgi:hypothetical protein